MASKRALPDDFSNSHPSKRPAEFYRSGPIDSFRPTHDRRPSDSSRASSGNHTPVNEKPPEHKRAAEQLDPKPTSSPAASKAFGDVGTMLSDLLKVINALSITSLQLSSAEKEVERCRADYKTAEKSFANYPAFGELKLVALRREEAVLEHFQKEARKLEVEREANTKQYADAIAIRSLPREDELVTKITRAVEARFQSRLESKDQEIENLKVQVGKQSDAITNIKNQCGDLRQEFGNSRTELRALKDDDALTSRKIGDIKASCRLIMEKVESKDSICVTREELEKTQVSFAVDQATICDDLKRSNEERPKIALLLANIQKDTARLVEESRSVKVSIENLDKKGKKHNKSVRRIEKRQQKHEEGLNHVVTDLGDAANPQEGSFEWRLQHIESRVDMLKGETDLEEGRLNVNHSYVENLIEEKQDELRDQFDKIIEDTSDHFNSMIRGVKREMIETHDICKSLETSVFKEIAVLEQTVEDSCKKGLERFHRCFKNAEQDTGKRLKALEAEFESLATKVAMEMQQILLDPSVMAHMENYQMKMELESLRQTCRNLEDRYMNTTSEHVVKAMCDEFNTSFGFDKYVNQLNSENSKVRREYAKILKVPQGLPAQVQTLESKLLAMTTSLSHLTQVTAAFDPQRIAEISMNLERVQTALSQQRNTTKEATARAQEQQALDQTVQGELNSRISMLITYAAGLRAELDALKADLEKLKERFSLGETRSGDLETQHEELRDRVDKTVMNWNLTSEGQKRNLATLTKDFVTFRDTSSKTLEMTAKATDSFEAEVKIKTEQLDNLGRRLESLKSAQDVAAHTATAAPSHPKRLQRQPTPGTVANGTGRSTPTTVQAPSPPTKKFLSKPTEQPRGRGRPPKPKAAGVDSSEGEGNSCDNPLWFDGTDDW